MRCHRQSALALAAMFVVGGCASTPTSSSHMDAYSPQQRSYEDQLADLADGETKGTRRKRPTRPDAAMGRASGQGVVDQPIRP